MFLFIAHKNVSEIHPVEIYVRVKFYIILITSVNINLKYGSIPYEKQSVRKAIYIYIYIYICIYIYIYITVVFANVCVCLDILRPSFILYRQLVVVI